MQNEKLTVIIPTRERADTLFHSIKTCVTQDYDNLTILVSDNLSRDNTREVVQFFKDPRIRYLRTNERLSMSDNFEFGLGHVESGYVCILGDDDGLLPGALIGISNIIQSTGFEAVNWKSDQYLWPSFKINRRSNLLKVSLSNKAKILSGVDELAKLIKCKNGYEVVPWLYKGFVNVNAINRIKSISGRFFNSMIPDVYSGIALANVVNRYVYSHRPFSLDAISNHSNGAAYTMKTADTSAAKIFLSEKNIPMRAGFLYCQSAYMLTAESIFQAIDNGILDQNRFEINLFDFFKASLQEVSKEPKDQYRNVVEAINFSASYFNIPSEKIESLVRQFPNRSFDSKYDYNVEGFNKFKNRIEIDAAKFSVSNVYEATLLHQQIRENPSKYLFIGAVASSTVKFIAREIKKRSFPNLFSK